jgi:phosphoglycerate dehydrogenase-like enzyme
MKFDNRRPRVLICDPIADVGSEMLQEHADVETKTDLTQAQLLNMIADYDAIVVRSATQVTASVINHGLRLKVIARAGAGLDNVDVAAAQARGIQVVNSPDANTVAVAEHTMGLLLSLARRLPRADSSLKEGKWEKKKFIGTGLAGKTLGIVGFGRIGREVAIRAQAFGMKILVNQRRPTPELNLVAGVEAVDLEDLLRQSDFVSLHVPLKPETQSMIGTRQLGLMKPTAYLINTARGDVIDEAALLEALNEDQIAGAALDVFAEEPAGNSALVQHERVIATPHIAASTEDAQQAAAVSVAEQIIEIFQDVDLESVLPLRVVSLDRVVPHESIDPRRVERLAQRLETERVLRNPPVVMELEDHRYMVLDGATRTAALKKLGYSHAIVQLSSPDDGLGLHTWHHVIQGINVSTLLQLLDDLPDVSLVATEIEKAEEELFEYGGLCYVYTLDDRVFLVQPAPGVNRLHALNELTEAYIAAADVARTLNKNILTLQHEYPEMAALVVFPEYTVNQVMQVTLTGRYFPAGITRFLIPGRVLRLNADLEYLRSDRSLREKNRWLHELLVKKISKGGIRYYAEPVYLLDE